MAAKDDGFGISESSLQHLIDSFSTIAATFNDILKAERDRKRRLAETDPPKKKSGGGPVAPSDDE